jgi:ABC-2 type transport system permease protein
MQALLAVIRKEFLAMARDVHGLLVLFAMPAVFILVMSLALRDTFQPSLSEKARWQVWNGDGTPAAAAVLARLPAPTARAAVRDRADLGRALARGDIQLGLVIAPGFAEALAATGPAHPVVTVLAEPGMPPALIAAFRAEVTQAVMAERVKVLLAPVRAMAEEAGTKLPAEEQLAAGALVEFKFHRDSAVPLTAVQQSVPAWLVFAMFFVVIPLSTIFIAEKQQGTLPRLRSLQVPVATLLAGKVIPFYLVNLGQTALMLLVGRYLVPRCGGDALQLELDWLALWAMASAVSLAAIGFALAVAALARTTEQATTIGGVANILFGALGGVMVPKLVMPAGMQQATWFSPMAWGLDGFLAVFVRGAHVGQLGGPLGLLLGFAAVGLTAAWWRLRAPE